MKKKLVAIGLLFIFLCTLATSVSAAEMNVVSPSAVLIDAQSGKVLYGKEEHAVREPASVTKVMTMLLTLKAIEEGRITMEDEVLISSYAAGIGGTQLFIEAGERRKVEELFYGVAVESANDAAVALGEHIGGSNEAFVAMMNEEAQRLGAVNTTFKNANGLTESGHVTTAYDIALMSMELCRYENVFQYTSTWMVDINIGKNNDKTRTLANTNKLLKTDSAIDGLKTGYTSSSMYCISATKKQGEMRLIAVVMGAPSIDERSGDVLALFNYGFANFEGRYHVRAGQEFGEVSISRGEVKMIKAIAAEDIYEVVAKGGSAEVQIVPELEKNVKVPVEAGQKVGRVVVMSEGQEVGACDLIAQEGTGRVGFFSYIGRIIRSYFYIG